MRCLSNCLFLFCADIFHFAFRNSISRQYGDGFPIFCFRERGSDLLWYWGISWSWGHPALSTTQVHHNKRVFGFPVMNFVHAILQLLLDIYYIKARYVFKLATYFSRQISIGFWVWLLQYSIFPHSWLVGFSSNLRWHEISFQMRL